MKVGIIREEKNLPDSRVPLTPEKCQYLSRMNKYLEIFIQSSEKRCFPDSEYREKTFLWLKMLVTVTFY